MRKYIKLLVMRSFLFIFLYIPSTLSFSQAQEAKGRSFEVPLSGESAFDKVIDLALKEDFFISNVDKKANFLQMNNLSYKNKNGLVSNGERLTYNFVIRKKNDSTSVVFLQVRIEDNLYKNYVSYYVDKGVTNDTSYYYPIIKKLNQIIQTK